MSRPYMIDTDRDEERELEIIYAKGPRLFTSRYRDGHIVYRSSSPAAHRQKYRQAKNLDADIKVDRHRYRHR